MSLLDELSDYARHCIEDPIHNGQKHRWACERFLRDLDRLDAHDRLFWDEERAQSIIDWFSYLYHSKGPLAGTPICLTDWQRFRLCQIYGWHSMETGLRRFRKSFTEVGRKNAKSQEEAGISLYEISVTAVRNGEVAESYTAGTKRDQSKIVFNEAGLMLKRSPLRAKFNVTKNFIEHIASGSFMRPLTKDDGQNGDGTNPAVLTLDEYHQHATTEFYDLALGSQTREPLLNIITTAGRDLTYPCYVQEYAYCTAVLDPSVDVENDEYLIDICELDPPDYADPANISVEAMYKANPIRMSYPEGREKILADYQIAKDVPEKMTAWLTKVGDVWVLAKENGYMNMAAWKACEVKELPIDVRGRSVYVGFDMSAKIDMTSVAFVIPYDSGICNEDGIPLIRYIVYSHSFLPNYEKVAERKRVDKMDYDSWERNGYLSVTNTQIVDQNAVMRYVLTTCKEHEWHIECLCFDPANAAKLMMDLSEEGYVVEEVFQSHKHLNEATQGFREQVICGNVAYLPNPVLNYAMSNAVIRRNNGLIKIDKDVTTKRIDPVDAVLCAYKLAMYHTFSGRYEDAIDAFLEMDL